MRDVDLIKKVESDGLPESIFKVNYLPEYTYEDYDLFNEKDFKQYISTIEKIVRGSYEYRAFITYLRENIGMNKCSFFKNISNEDTYKIRIEIHHSNLTLYDIVQIVYNKRVAYNENLDEELVAKEVIILHYLGLISLIPLSETVHILVHNNYIFIPLDKAYGKWEDFIAAYEDYITPEIKDKLDRNIDFTNGYHDMLQDNVLLQRKYIYYDTSDVFDLPPYEDIIDYMNQKIESIKNGENQILIEPIRFNRQRMQEIEQNKRVD